MKLNSFLIRFCSDLCFSSVELDDLREEKKPSEAARGRRVLITVLYCSEAEHL